VFVSLIALVPIGFVASATLETGWIDTAALVWRPRVGELLINTALLMIIATPLCVVSGVGLAIIFVGKDITGMSDIGPVDPFGFSWPRPFRCENPRSWVLDFLGFSWISSSGFRFFNGLRSLKRGKVLTHAFSPAFEAPQRAPVVEAMRKPRIGHGASLT
jgi:hypothetical protein